MVVAALCAGATPLLHAPDQHGEAPIGSAVGWMERATADARLLGWTRADGRAGGGVGAVAAGHRFRVDRTASDRSAVRKLMVGRLDNARTSGAPTAPRGGSGGGAHAASPACAPQTVQGHPATPPVPSPGFFNAVGLRGVASPPRPPPPWPAPPSARPRHTASRAPPRVAAAAPPPPPPGASRSRAAARRARAPPARRGAARRAPRTAAQRVGAARDGGGSGGRRCRRCDRPAGRRRRLAGGATPRCQGLAAVVARSAASRRRVRRAARGRCKSRDAARVGACAAAATEARQQPLRVGGGGQGAPLVCGACTGREGAGASTGRGWGRPAPRGNVPRAARRAAACRGRWCARQTAAPLPPPPPRQWQTQPHGGGDTDAPRTRGGRARPRGHGGGPPVCTAVNDLLWNRNWNFFPGAVRRRCAHLATHRSGRRRGGARNGTGDAPQRPPTWQHPPEAGKRSTVTEATADAPRPPQRPQDSKHFSTSSSRPGPPPRNVAANAAATQRGPPAPAPPRKHGGSGRACTRTQPSARTAHRANGAGRDGGWTGVAARTAGDGGMSSGSNGDGITVDHAATAAAATAAAAAATGPPARGGAPAPTDEALATTVPDPPSRGRSELDDEEGTPSELERIRLADAAVAAVAAATAIQGTGAAAATGRNDAEVIHSLARDLATANARLAAYAPGAAATDAPAEDTHRYAAAHARAPPAIRAPGPAVSRGAAEGPERVGRRSDADDRDGGDRFDDGFDRVSLPDGAEDTLGAFSIPSENEVDDAELVALLLSARRIYALGAARYDFLALRQTEPALADAFAHATAVPRNNLRGSSAREFLARVARAEVLASAKIGAAARGFRAPTRDAAGSGGGGARHGGAGGRSGGRGGSAAAANSAAGRRGPRGPRGGDAPVRAVERK
ncbi:hypothetical protein BU14_0319s0025 [Porphyra umbilicalis]|uniref:Uncharacterized protein n=1 Tax=Porphyra umbilicalis TaxID=2786 RepID=A0A1X6NZD6_PORUM|nr:hypothetical protein BU14_0319s0025 [Porphyra umbilicalis]|eukprot:OSX73937.1 hypothetical protein BU14_0319s0025 [Porphyra umbilicalis]